MSLVRSEFAALDQKISGFPLVYLDSAATTLKPKSVVRAIEHFYSNDTANVHRGAHSLGDRATEQFEKTRDVVARFLHTKSPAEIVFTKGTTEGINLVAQTWGRKNLKKGDAIIISEMEHHANIVPWQLLAEEIGFEIRWVPLTDSAELDFTAYEALLDKKVKLVSLVHASNSVGTVNPIETFFARAKAIGAITLADVAQSITVTEIDVQTLNCDFLVFSAHKIYGPFGVGVLYGREEILKDMPPYQAGGAMIADVSKERTTFLAPPQRFEAGTPNISGVIALRFAIEFVEELTQAKIRAHETELSKRLILKLRALSGITEVGASPSRVNIVSFLVDGQHPADIGQLLNQQGVAVRTGHHCNLPLMKRFKIPGTVRASFGVYNSVEDVDILIEALKKAQELLK